ncbi:related to alpha,alpha-trehalose-phosphate synthase, 115 KD subunit [Serendipita indica DSM 11827]|uniref:Related to alpha,alpha-trehalose-phosphate synthase, 115 KD subunit n=1 Tax=Serendipita indica (strain DSM 11827) TaxID=1109443 RepID=G4T575_SERID|nr:related to alpha,alpha-trehalose-phosphate synthase, 115 KD subunit [Serendipita indica DSM 11827]
MASFSDHRILIASLFLPTSTAVQFHPHLDSLTPKEPRPSSSLDSSISPTAPTVAISVDGMSKPPMAASTNGTTQKSPTIPKFSVNRPTHTRQNTSMSLKGAPPQSGSIIENLIAAEGKATGKQGENSPVTEKRNPFASFASGSHSGKLDEERAMGPRKSVEEEVIEDSESEAPRGRLPISLNTKGHLLQVERSKSRGDLELTPTTPLYRRLSRKQSKTDFPPLTRDQSIGPWEIETNPNANGGLHNAVKSIENDLLRAGKLWVGVLGPETDDIPTEMRSDIEERMKEKDSVPVWVSDGDFKGCYDDFCHQVLWPSLHYIIPDAPRTKVMYESSSFIQYKAVNQAFADKIASVYKDGDIIWINDYHLMLLPQLLRARLPKAAIGFFLHVAFPSSEIFRCLAARESLLHGILGADLVGFQTHSYARHFRQTVSRILSVEATPKGIQLRSGPNLKGGESLNGSSQTALVKDHQDTHNREQTARLHGHEITALEKAEQEVDVASLKTLNEHGFVDVAVFPMGIDVQSLTQKRMEREVEEWVHVLRERYKGMQMIVARDKLDEVQGVRQKFLAFERFLEQNERFQGKVMLIQVALSTSSINELQGNVMDVVSRINMKFANLTYQPIIFFHTQDVTFSQYLALLTVADCFIVTSMREGMALRTHEYVECQTERKRPLILSEFTGSYSFSGFRTCLPINPWDIQMTADAILSSLTMSDDEAATRWADLHSHVNTQTAQAFATSFLTRVLRVNYKHHFKDSILIPSLDVSKIRERYHQGEKKRLILIDLERTLWTFDISSPPQDVEVPGEAMNLLERLVNDERNEVWALSGLPIHGKLATIAKRLPQLGICAEHGCFIKPRDDEEWVTMINDNTSAWMPACMEILQYFSERTPNSFIDKRQATIVWRFASTDDEGTRAWARRQAAEAQNHIYDSLGERFRLRIIPSPSSFIVLPKIIGRTPAVAAILNVNGIRGADIEKPINMPWPTPDMGDILRYEYILAVGGDESLMNRLKRVKNAETIYTGVRQTGGSNWRCEPDRIYGALEEILRADANEKFRDRTCTLPCPIQILAAVHLRAHGLLYQEAEGAEANHNVQEGLSREGRDTNDIENALEDDVDEEEVKAFYAKFAARPLESNEAKYDEPIDGSSGVEDEEDDTNEILARHLQKQRDELIASPDYIQEKKIQKNSTLDDDVDHELGETLREISIRGSKYNIGSKGDTYNDTKKKKLEIQWTPELEKMSREKAEAEARTALKERLKSSAVRGSGIKPRPAGPAPHSKALGNKPEMEDLEDYLDDLLR